jgi:hypothetical protein
MTRLGLADCNFLQSQLLISGHTNTLILNNLTYGSQPGML